MRSIDLLCPCSMPNNDVELKETHDTELIDSINATLKEVSTSITESNTDIKNALNNLTTVNNDAQEQNNEQEREDK